MWPFARKDKAKDAAEDIRTLLNLYEELLRDSLQRIAGGFVAMMDRKGDASPMSEAVQTILYDGHPVVRRFVNHYVSCRRKHGDIFLNGVRGMLIPTWKEDAEKRKESLERMALFLIEGRLAALLMLTRECPEMEELYDYMSAITQGNKAT